MKTDNRWGVGALETKIPEDARAVYSARWIDHGEFMDVVPDRQGFAYDEPMYRDRLIQVMEHNDLRKLAATLPHGDEPVQVVNLVSDNIKFVCWMRRTGGYVYVAAWIT